MSKIKSFLGPTYALKSINYDSQRCINWHPEFDEVQTGKEQEPCMLAPTSGYTLQHSLPRNAIRGLFHTANNYVYCVAGNGLFQLVPTVSAGVLSWSHILLAYLTTSSGFVSIIDGIPNQYQGVANTGLINQVVVVDGSSTGYVFQEGTTQVYQMNDGTGFAGSNFVSFQDGFFLFSQPNTISGYYAADPQNINDANTFEANINNDNVSRIISDHDIVWVLGNRSLSVWQNTGGSATTNLFQQIPGATAPTGCAAPWSVAQVGGQLLWVINDNNGYGEVAMAFGYRPMRVSNHAVEIWLQNQGDISQVIAWAYQEEGHSWYILNSPTSTTSWAYDIAHKEWHERAYFSNGAYSRDLGNFHTNVFISGYGQLHLVGDYQNGNIYSIDSTNFTHNGAPIVRTRITPHQSAAYKRMFYPQLQLDVQAGTGLDGVGLPIQIGTGTPTLQTATNVLMSGNGPTYTLVGNDGTPQTPVVSVTVASNGAVSNWSGSYTTVGNQVTINPAPLTSGLVTIGTGNGTEVDFQIPNIYPAAATAQIYVNDWRGNNLQQQAPAQNTNLCTNSYDFAQGWTMYDAVPNGQSWFTPDYAQSEAGTFLTEDSTCNPHGMSIPYAVVSGQTTNLSIYATAESTITSVTLTGGQATFTTSGTAPAIIYTMTLNVLPTNGILALGDVVTLTDLAIINQTLTALIGGTLGAVGSTYQCSPGWVTNQGQSIFTAARTDQRYLELSLGLGQTGTASALFNLQAGTIILSQNCTPVMTPVAGFPSVYRCSITYAETNTTGTILTVGAAATGTANQMTLAIPPTFGAVTIGSTLWVAGISTGITILSLASGTINQIGSVYNLSAPCPFSNSLVQFGTPSTTTVSTATGTSIQPSAYVQLIDAGIPHGSFPLTESYPGNGSAYVGVWGCQIGPQAALLPLIQTAGASAYDQVTYTANQGLLAFEIPPFAEVENTALTVVQPAAVITGTFSATAPQLLPTEYTATFQYMQGTPIYEYTGTNPQIGLSYSYDGGYTFSAERYCSLGPIGNRLQRLIWRKIKGGVRDMVFKVTCSDPVLVNLLGAEIDVKAAENAPR